MSGKDISQKQLEEYSDVFADIVNVLLFDGENVVDPDDLIDAPTFSAYHDDSDKKIRKLERDVAKYWKSENIRLSYIGIENQTDIYKYMPLRIIGYDGTIYRNELNKHEESEKNEIVPVVTMVLYFGHERLWKKPQSLKDCLKIPQKLDPYVNDYKLNLFEIAWLPDETIEKFQSDFRFLAEYFSQIRKTQDWKPMPKKAKHIQALFDAFAALTKDNRFVEYFLESREGEITMPSIALDKAESRGFERGILQGISQGISQGIEQVAVTMLHNGNPLKEIQNATKLSLDHIRRLAENLNDKNK
ncbi:MAG: Rpn family recombination-promoting nuclease/putative transposase [Selenomonadaceae bacterium]|nr:Rpn family recombination-promoting nuclease/putative transposase [Selenomonadaceae bacterium]